MHPRQTYRDRIPRVRAFLLNWMMAVISDWAPTISDQPSPTAASSDRTAGHMHPSTTTLERSTCGATWIQSEFQRLEPETQEPLASKDVDDAQVADTRTPSDGGGQGCD
jgi:hypothetical protein